MIRFRRPAAAAMIAGAVLSAAAAAPAAAAAGGSHHGAHHTQVHPAFTGNSVNIIEGTGFGLGAPDPTAGHPVTQEAEGRTVTWVHTGTYLGFDAGYWVLNVNGNVVAMNASCAGSTVKADRTANGTVWFMEQIGTKWYVGSRYCDNQQHGDIVLTGDGQLHHQFAVAQIGACCGNWQKMSIF